MQCTPTRSSAPSRTGAPTATPTRTPTPPPTPKDSATVSPEACLPPAGSGTLVRSLTAAPEGSGYAAPGSARPEDGLSDNVSYRPGLAYPDNDARGKELLSQQQNGGAVDSQTVGEIGAIYDATDRNYAITQSYHNLGNAMGDYLGDGAGNNWATFASWASARAGQTIRGEDTMNVLGVDVPMGATPIVQSEISYGNRKVYADVAPVYASFLEASPDTDAEFAQWADSRELSPRMREAFEHYYNAHGETDPTLKAQEVATANLLIGAHEQEMLQPQIQGALSPVGIPLGGALTSIMDLPLPGGTVSLSQDLSGSYAPPQGRLSELVCMFNREGSGAGDWSNYGDRMNFITDLFLTRQFDERLATEVPR